jgi:hypothetical protein
MSREEVFSNEVQILDVQVHAEKSNEATGKAER